MTASAPTVPLSSLAGAPAAGNPAFPNCPDEQVFRTDQIQGNLLVGFSKDHVMLLFLQIDDPAAAKLWLSSIAPTIASADEVLAFNRLFKAAKQRRGFEGAVKATWINIAFSAGSRGQARPGRDR